MKFNRSILNSKNTAVSIIGISMILYIIWAYNLARFEHSKLLLIYSVLFGSYYFIVKNQKIKESWLSYLAVLFRLLFLVAIPNLSQDFYRFVWDGRLILEGLNPYLHTPNELMESSIGLFPQMNTLYEGMGALSAKHYSNYPPVHQMPFIIAAFISKHSILGSIVVLRLILISADLGILVFGKKLLKKLNKPTRTMYWFILNPLVIIELTGNLHFEGLMLCLFIMSLYFIHSKKWHMAAVVMALSIAVKLVPVLSLPLFLNKLGWKKSVLFYSVTAAVFIILFIPFFSFGLLENFSATIGLWFSNFEFNASVYYFLKGTLENINGVSVINSMGIIVACVVTLQTSYLLLKKKKETSQIILMILWILSGYYFISTTVHPWYIISLLLLSVFTNYKFVLVWSYTLILSYIAYNEFSVEECNSILIIEYTPVILMLGWELYSKKFLKIKAS
ncbi:MAG: polyprenol phosphomannose-dependent alpha 1,6 mannosyltransferase MptB [Flavobacteriaceae bacterium]